MMFSLLWIVFLSALWTLLSPSVGGVSHAPPTPNPQTSTPEPRVSTPKSSFKRAYSSEAPVHALVKRLLPEQYHDHFVFKLDPELVPASLTNIHDTFRVSNNNGNTMIEGATLAGLGSGLNYYLRSVCKVEMSWSGDRFNDMPTIPPTITEPTGVTRASFVPWRYYMNVVTFGYSFAFWDWKRWERELDWMFLNGINMALAMVGQEYVFRQMYEDLGLTREELNGFFAGPAFMPWQRMGNIQGSWALPNDTQFKHDWIDSQWDLQQLIMGRMDEFNITAILPSFNGFVPEKLPLKFPGVEFNRSSDWGYVPEPHSKVWFIPSTEPFFSNLTKQFIHTQESLYQQNGLKSKDGANNYYLLDLFNELSPVCVKVECLRQTTSGVMKALKQADPQAVWAMQSWFLIQQNVWKEAETKAFFDGIKEVNEGKDAFIIDLYSDVRPFWNSTEGFFGIDWGWSMLNNFGGAQGLYGTLPALLTEPFKGYRQYPKAMRGMGITMEGINNNEYLYHLALDIPWESVEGSYPSGTSEIASISEPVGQELKQPPLDGQKHLESFIKRRYGPNQTQRSALSAWTTLSQTVWDCRTNQIAQSRSYLDITPALDMNRPMWLSTKFWYTQTKVVRAWSQLIQSTITKTSSKRRGHEMVADDIDRLLRTTSEEFDPSIVGHDDKTPVYPGPTQSKWASSQFKRDDSNPVPLSKESNLPLNVSSFRYDLVDVTREIMAAIVIPGLHKELVEAYNASDLTRTRSRGNSILQAIKDTDRILATHTHFMLGPWIRDARLSAKKGRKSNARSPLNVTDHVRYQDYLELDARNQITWWSPIGQQPLADYAGKEWSGVVKGYYYPRWKLFVDRLVSAVKRGHQLDYKAYLEDSLKVESKWLKQTTCLGSTVGDGCSSRVNLAVLPIEDTVVVAQDLLFKWYPTAARLAAKADKAEGRK